MAPVLVPCRPDQGGRRIRGRTGRLAGDPVGPGYIAVNMGAAGTNTNWPARYAALRQLSQVTDPAAFAAAAAHTQFGPVDVFILTARAARSANDRRCGAASRRTGADRPARPGAA